MNQPTFPQRGDVLICQREEAAGRAGREVFIVARWPDLETVVAGPYVDYSYAAARARRLAAGTRRSVWRQRRAIGLRDEAYDRLDEGAAGDE
jgi:hypothetical protein